MVYSKGETTDGRPMRYAFIKHKIPIVPIKDIINILNRIVKSVKSQALKR